MAARARKYPPCAEDWKAIGRAQLEVLLDDMDRISASFNSMVTDDAKAAFSQTFIRQYRTAYEKSWPDLCRMLELIEKSGAYAKPWKRDGEEQKIYSTFEEYYLSEVEPFLGSFAKLREKYQRHQRGEITLEEGALDIKRAQRNNTIAKCREAYQAMKDAGEKVTQQAVADRVGVSRTLAEKYWAEIDTENGQCPDSVSKPTQKQRAAEMGISPRHLSRLDAIAKHSDLQARTKLPKDDPKHLSAKVAYTEAQKRNGRVFDLINPAKREVEKLNEDSKVRFVQWLIPWLGEQGVLDRVKTEISTWEQQYDHGGGGE